MAGEDDEKDPVKALALASARFILAITPMPPPTDVVANPHNYVYRYQNALDAAQALVAATNVMRTELKKVATMQKLQDGKEPF